MYVCTGLGSFVFFFVVKSHVYRMSFVDSYHLIEMKKRILHVKSNRPCVI